MKSKYCLSSTTSFDKINKAATNRSITKQTFSFARSSRFEAPKSNCPRNTYGGDFISRQPSGTSIGYGKKSDFTRCLTVSPSSSKYNLKSFWEENQNKKRGSSFGLSRDKVCFNQYISKDQLKMPSPTHYNKEKPNKINSPKYTLRQKTTIFDKTKTIEPQNKNPGPGSYNNPELESSSSKRASKFQNISYGQSKSVRFMPADTMPPGPGKYKEVSQLSNTGTYVLSKNQGGTRAKFDRDRRESMFDKVFKKELANPGPGYYQVPSQFGQYDGDIYNELRTSKRSQNGWKIQTERPLRR